MSAMDPGHVQDPRPAPAQEQREPTARLLSSWQHHCTGSADRTALGAFGHTSQNKLALNTGLSRCLR